jgi:thiamine monophosphate synthase
MKTFKSFVSENAKTNKVDSFQLRIKSLNNQKNHIDDVLKQTKKIQTLNKAYQTISNVNKTFNTKKELKKNVK